ncbi:Threonine/homoserine efflux transporter RhtA [Salinihabitans flavidus]|uniref:Threonine/homoserine efflux transporter RhtA n=1 Tax=Salinihabitans flavidus TaxID=569882 RepID=A0A1H8SK62_9RHOB|nr:DMT family transporter [Salinihabitans flavidus]SEO78955.1 Threonine/homoserine efflux transporter RhtA [Salinihabitans flavidus]
MVELPRFLTESEAAEKRSGMIMMCAAMLMLPVGDAISKLLTEIVSPFDVTLWRTVAQALFFIPLGFFMRRRLAGRMFSLPTLVSGGLIVVVLFCLITAFETMPIATAIAIFFVEPLFLTLLAGPLLGEVAGPRRYAAVAVGLIGALIVIRPNFAVFGPVVLLPALGALAYALNMIVVRRATRVRSALTFQLGATFSSAGVLIVVYGIASLFGREAAALTEVPGWAIWAILGAGALAALTFLLITFAFSKAEASVLAPFQYLEIVGATIVSFAIFGDFPDAMTWLGTAIILASGVYVFHRERKADTAHKVKARSDR